MNTESFVKNLVKVTFVTCGALIVLALIIASGTPRTVQAPMMAEWFDADEAPIVTGRTIPVASDGTPIPSAAMDIAMSPAATPNTEPRVIKTGAIDMTTEDVAATVTDIEALAMSFQGFVQTSTLSDNEIGEASAFIIIRVPTEVFETAMADIQLLGAHVNTESVSGEDVTAQYIDLAARLSAAQAQEAQYLNILESATTVGEVLAVQEHLADVRADIESLQGQITYLADRTDLATISVSLSEETSVSTAGDTKFDPMRDAKRAIDFVITLGQQLVSVLIWALILGIAIGIPVAIVWLMTRLFMRRQSGQKRRK